MSMRKKYKAFKALLTNAIWVRNNYGRTVWSQLFELMRLRFAGIGTDAYFKFCLFDDSKFTSPVEKLSYRDWRFREELRKFSPVQVQGIAYHKHVLYRLLDSYAVPVPKIHGLYCPVPFAFERHRAMTTPEELFCFLQETNALPMFGKPSNASHGFGGYGIQGRADAESFQMITGEKREVGQVAEDIHRVACETGMYLFCEFLECKDWLKALSGPALPSFRIVVLIQKGEPEVHMAELILPIGVSHVSNFRKGESNSIICRVDSASGVVARAIDSLGPNMHCLEEHPISGTRLKGLRIPEWPEITEIVLDAAKAMSPFRIQLWDVALTNRGPVMLEMNFVGDLDGIQASGPPGIFTERFRRFFATHRVAKG